MQGTRRRTAHRCATTSLWLVLALLSGCVSTQDAGPSTASPPAPDTRPPPAAPRDPRELGSADAAAVTIIEFTDIQCPYCARFALETWPALRQRYVDTGRVRFVSRDLPLSFHPYALPAAVAARCAGEQGRFFEYREALFRGQARLADAPYDAIASRFGLDVDRFAACRRQDAVVVSVREDAALAAANGISSTPTFVIGREVDGQFMGEVLSGAQPLDVFVQHIEALLVQK
jgi:protein-disulfide isomerase